jgi:hypothetical protein
MDTRSRRRLTVFAVLALATAAAVTACTATGAVKPLPNTTGSPEPGVTSPTPAASVAISPRPVRVVAPPASRPACLGAVVHRIDASDNGPPWKPLCIAVGGVLRVENLGPDGFTMSPAGKVSCWYEAGVRECRLIQTGSVRFTIVNAHETRTLALVIAKASSPTGPISACTGFAAYTIDASDGGPPWPALCMRLGTLLRIENLGPDGLTVSPEANVTGWYEAAFRELTFVKTGTVTSRQRGRIKPPAPSPSW